MNSPDQSDTPSVLFERDGAVAKLTLNRAAVANAIDMRLARELMLAAIKCDEDESIRCVLLTASAGRFFCAGGDIRSFLSAGSSIGSLLKEMTAYFHMAIARFARTLATMFAAGVPLVEALESVAGATGNIVYENGVLRMRDEVATGQRLQRAMETTELFPNMVVQMIAVGEESGSLDTMAAKVATFYEAEVDNAVDAMSSLLEPLIMVILGVLVGGLVIAMYLPIFKLGSVV